MIINVDLKKKKTLILLLHKVPVVLFLLHHLKRVRLYETGNPSYEMWDSISLSDHSIYLHKQNSCWRLDKCLKYRTHDLYVTIPLFHKVCVLSECLYTSSHSCDSA